MSPPSENAGLLQNVELEEPGEQQGYPEAGQVEPLLISPSEF